ncbi:hypothetical protein C1H76_0204 [Elsinoe australis]|uniref:Uncharacterized protein n=1 Tax=Elsinoe australis TaxID=40998 RepID=A0A4U7BGL9_9PEZI|nr:hypothetical protein C1H76_0204 [Elsinoe australis]
MKNGEQWKAWQTAKPNNTTKHVARPEGGKITYERPRETTRYLYKYELPNELREGLSSSLIKLVDQWTQSAAAVKNDLQHFKKLDLQETDAGWPVKSPVRRLSRADSDPTNEARLITLCSPSPPTSFPSSVSGSFVHTSGNNPGPLRLFTDTDSMFQHKTSTISGAPDTPPYSPDSAVPVSGPVSAAPSVDSDVESLQLDLGGLDVNEISQSFSSDVSSSLASPIAKDPIPHGDTFDPEAWRKFAEKYTTDLSDVRKGDLFDMIDRRRCIDRKYREICLDGDDDEGEEAKDMTEETKAQFETWWQRMGQKHDKLEARIEAIPLPDLEEVKRIRVLHGLPI